MKVQEMRDKAIPELRKALLDATKSLSKKKIHQSLNPSNSVAAMRTLKKEIAQLNTVIREKELQAK